MAHLKERAEKLKVKFCFTYKDIANQTGLSQATIRNFIIGSNWSDKTYDIIQCWVENLEPGGAMFSPPEESVAGTLKQVRVSSSLPERLFQPFKINLEIEFTSREQVQAWSDEVTDGRLQEEHITSEYSTLFYDVLKALADIDIH